MNEPQIDYYKILGLVSEQSTAEEIKTAYRQLAKEHHPDKNPENPELAKEKMAKLNQAYEILSNPVKREEYDKKKLRAYLNRKRRASQNKRPFNNKYKPKPQENGASWGVILAGIALVIILGSLDDD